GAERTRHARSQALACAPATGVARARAAQWHLSVPQVRRKAACAQRRCLRGARVRARALEGAPACAPEVLLWQLPECGAGECALTADRAQLRRPWTARTRDRLQVLRSSALVSAEPDLCACGARARSCHDGRVGRITGAAG